MVLIRVQQLKVCMDENADIGMDDKNSRISNTKHGRFPSLHLL